LIRPRALPLPERIEVSVADYAVLLGYRRAPLPTGRVTELADESRAWFAEHCGPWGVARTLEIEHVGGDRIRLEQGASLSSPVLAERFARARAKRLVVVLVSAGAEIDRRIDQLWAGERPDEAYFLDRFGAAATRWLAVWAAGHLAGVASREGLATLPAYSPGFDGWPLVDQAPLAACLGNGPPSDFKVLESGMMRPRNTLLAAVGLTADRAAAESARRRHGCSWCSLERCNLRRSAFLPDLPES
jgi:hypothetical protein